MRLLVGLPDGLKDAFASMFPPVGLRVLGVEGGPLRLGLSRRIIRLFRRAFSVVTTYQGQAVAQVRLAWGDDSLFVVSHRLRPLAGRSCRRARRCVETMVDKRPPHTTFLGVA